MQMERWGQSGPTSLVGVKELITTEVIFELNWVPNFVRKQHLRHICKLIRKIVEVRTIYVDDADIGVILSAGVVREANDIRVLLNASRWNNALADQIQKAYKQPNYLDGKQED